MLLTISYLESAYPIASVEPLKAILYDYFGISVYFVYFIFIIKTRFMFVCLFVCLFVRFVLK